MKGTVLRRRCWWLACCALIASSVSAQIDDNHFAERGCSLFFDNLTELDEARRVRFERDLFAGLDGLPIRNIFFDNQGVFNARDPEEDNALYRFLNNLHVNTRSSVIGAQLLFKAGDSLDTRLINESERILRQRNYLTDAYIVPLKRCETGIDVVVVTKDSWALEPRVSMSKESEGTNSGFALSDGNIGGTGASLTIGYEQTTKRNLISYDFRTPHIARTQLKTRFYYADTSDGRDIILELQQPFYSLHTPWAGGGMMQDVTLDQTIRHMDEEINEFGHQRRAYEFFYGRAFDLDVHHTQRWLVGFTNEQDNFYRKDTTLQDIPDNREAIYPWIEYQWRANRYGLFKNLHQIQRPEDVAIGHNLTLRLGQGGTLFDNPDDVYRVIGRYSFARAIRDDHLLEAGVNLDARYHTSLSTGNSRVLGFNLGYHYLEDAKRRWYAGMQYDIGQDLAQFEELTVGDVNGLRGYPTDFQRGKQRYRFTLERRYFTDIHLFNLMRVGTVVFVDAGKSWGLDHYGKSELLTNVGVGLRLSSSKVRIGNVIHIDIATPTTARDGLDSYQLTIGAHQRF